MSGLLLMVPANSYDFYVGLMCLAIGLVLALRFIDPRPSKATRRRWAAFADDTFTYTINETGVTAATRGQYRQLAWSAITEARDDGEILMFLRHGLLLCWLDRASFASPEERASVVAFVRDQLAAAKATGVPAKVQEPRRISGTRLLAIGLVVLLLGYAAWTGLNRASIFGPNPDLIGGETYSNVAMVVNGQLRGYSPDSHTALEQAVPILLQALGNAKPYTGNPPDPDFEPVWVWLPATDVPGLPSGAPTTRLSAASLFLRLYFDTGVGVLGIQYQGDRIERYYQLDPAVMKRLADILYPVEVPGESWGV